jgi:hypothetical protein
MCALKTMSSFLISAEGHYLSSFCARYRNDVVSNRGGYLGDDRSSLNIHD